MHCDMQAPVWNPIVQLLSRLFNYNATLLSFELLLYYVTGATGCLYLASHFCRDLRSCVVIAVIYGCGGFATSILEYMSWVGSFAFLPWAVHFFYLLLKRRDAYVAIGLSISLWLMLVCGYPSFLIYLGYCLAAVTLAYFYLLYSQKRVHEIAGIVKWGLFSILLFVILSLPAIHSFYEYLPYYSRGNKALDEHINGESFAWNYPMSLLLPVAGICVLDNDIYIGLVPLLVLVAGMRKKLVLTFRDKFLLAGVLFTFLFTLGRSTPIRMWSARHLPLLAAFGFSHNVRIFLMLAVFVWLAAKMDLFFSEGGGGSVRMVRRGAGVAGLILVAYLAIGYHRIVFERNLVRVVFYASALWQLVLLGALCFSSWLYASANRLFFFILAELSLSVLIVAPLTGFTLTPPGVYNRSAAKFYRSDVKDNLWYSGVDNPILPPRDSHTEVNAFKSVSRRNFPSNTRMQVYWDYVHDSVRCKKLLSMPFVFADDGTALKVDRVELGYNFIDVDVRAADSCQMVIRQTYYTRWRADRPAYAPSAWKGMLLQTRLKKGENKVRLFYYKKDLILEGIFAIITSIAIGIALFIRHRVKKGVQNF